uniref:Uncharacterized protein n=1 Tax=Chenopodium quinoa TaxID=63459 RepID=A0A803MHA4_CHEQI
MMKTPPFLPQPRPSIRHMPYRIQHQEHYEIALDQEALLNYCFRFKHVHAFNVLDHIDATVSRASEVDDASWKRLDVVVKQ